MGNPVVILPFILAVISSSYAQDVGVKSFTVTTPTDLTTSLCSADTAYTFNIVVCEISGTAATVTAVNLYYTNNVNYQDSTTTGTATEATLDGGTTISVDANGEATDTGATATILTDAACASYTHICAVTTTTSDTYTSNDDACIALAGGTTSTINCPAAECTDPGDIANGQKTGDSYDHGDIVTYTCDDGYNLVGDDTLTCYDGSWDNVKPTCADASVTSTVPPVPTTVTVTQNGTDVPGMTTVSDSGVAGIANGIYCVLISLCLYTVMIMQ